MKRLLYSVILIICLSMGNFAYGSTEHYEVDDLFQNHGSIMMLIDPETGVILDANIATEKFYGYPLEELKTMNIDQINMLTPEELKIERELALKEKRNYFIFRHKLKAGEIKDVEVYSYPIVRANEKTVLFSIVHDITPRVIAEQEAKESQRTIVFLLGLISLILLILFFSTNRSKRKIKEANDKLKRLFDNMEEGVALHEIICDKSGIPVDYRFLDVNGAFERITDLKLADIKNRNFSEVLPGAEKIWVEKYGKVALTGVPTSFISYSKVVGKHFAVSVYAPVLGQFVTVFTDISSQKDMEIALKKEKALFQTTLHSLGDGVISTDINGNIEIMNAVAESLTGWKKEMAKGKPFDEVFHLMDAFTGERLENPITKILETEEAVIIDKELLLISASGENYPIEDSACPIKDEKGNVIGAVIVFRDYTDKKEKQEEILYLSYHDQLTGLYNRRFFEEELRRLDTPRNLPLTIAMVDVNGLKLTNDAFGHLAGDGLLKRVSQVLKEECRADDIVARIGGDEFVILLPRTTYKEAQKIIERIYKAFEEEPHAEIIISVSIGWETKTDEKQICTEVFIKAEEHMYRKKLTESQSMRSKTLQVILKTITEKSEVEKIHSKRVSCIGQKIGECLGLDDEHIQQIALAGIMHDIGKISIDNAILNKSERLSESEFEEIKKHSKNSYQILKSVDGFSSIAEYALSHHERWDGLGYPSGLRGTEIPLISRIIAIAEAYEVMTAYKPYRPVWTREEVVAEIRRNSGTQFDPSIVHACGELLAHLVE